MIATLGDTITTLLFGWIAFLWRVIPQVTVDRGSLVVAVVALILFAVGTHFIAKKCYRRFATDRTDLPSKWPLRSTLAIVAGVFVLFTAGISLIGATHQVAWLATSEVPLTGTGNGNRWVTNRTYTLKSIGLGLHNYHDLYETFPAGGSFDADGTARHSWVTPMLVYLIL